LIPFATVALMWLYAWRVPDANGDDMKTYKTYTISADGRITVHGIEATSKREARRIVEAARPRVTVMEVFEINEIGAILG